MPLASGIRLGSYEIVSPLGSGGMGEVYPAQHIRLGREVAIKVLPDVLATDPDRIARLEREAKVLASLNHPRIATLYGLDQSGDQRPFVFVRPDRRASVPGPSSFTLAEAVSVAFGR